MKVTVRAYAGPDAIESEHVLSEKGTVRSRKLTQAALARARGHLERLQNARTGDGAYRDFLAAAGFVEAAGYDMHGDQGWTEAGLENFEGLRGLLTAHWPELERNGPADEAAPLWAESCPPSGDTPEIRRLRQFLRDRRFWFVSIVSSLPPDARSASRKTGATSPYSVPGDVIEPVLSR